jgi:hypothetical protein
MNKNPKQIIAREGLILLGIILLAVGLALPEAHYNFDFFSFFLFFFLLYIFYLILRLTFWDIVSGILVTSFLILLLYINKGSKYLKFIPIKIAKPPLTVVLFCACLFILILLIRFIIWAVRTLREGK